MKADIAAIRKEEARLSCLLRWIDPLFFEIYFSN